MAKLDRDRSRARFRPLRAVLLLGALGLVAAGVGLAQPPMAPADRPLPVPTPMEKLAPDDKPTTERPNPEKPPVSPPMPIEVRERLDVLNTKVRADLLQEAMAAEGAPLVLRQTRLDRVFFQYVPKGGGVSLELRFEGVCLAEEYNDAAGKEHLRGELQRLVYSICGDLLKRFPKEKPEDMFPEQPVFSIHPVTAEPTREVEASRGIEAVKPEDHPRRKLQQLVQAEKLLDGALFHGATFNKNGWLVLDGLLGIGGQTSMMKGLLEKEAAARPSWLRKPDPKRTGKKDDARPEDIVVDLSSFEPVVLNMPIWNPVALLQGRLSSFEDTDAARPMRDLCRQTLVRRVWFAYEEKAPAGGGAPDEKKAVDLRCRIEGLCIDPGIKEKDASEQLHDLFKKECEASWKALHDSKRLVFAVPASVPVPKVMSVEPHRAPKVLLQRRAVRERDLDGSLIEKVEFDKDGTPVIKGFVNEEAHKVKIRSLWKELQEQPNWPLPVQK